MTNLYDIPSLREDRLSDAIPSRTYGGGAVGDPKEMLFLWRSCATEKAQGGTLAFFLDDSRLEPLAARPSHYAAQFRQCGIKALVEVDFSLWCDDSRETQLFNARRKKVVARVFQEHGLAVVPNLNWGTEESFSFCFVGTPVNAPVCMTECRTASSSAEDRRAFLRGLHEAVRQCQPATLVIYGGAPNAWWIERDLPQCPTQFVFLESWTDARGTIRKRQARELRNKNQLTFGGTQWADEEAAVA